MVQHLMPVSTEAPRCSEFARKIGVLPPGTGLFLSRVFLVTTPLPWPKPALNHPLLKPLSPLVTGSAVPGRLFAAEPNGSPSDQIALDIFERSDGGARHFRWEVSDAHALEELMARATAAEIDALGDVRIEGVRRTHHGAIATNTVLICTQGGHDVCCGTTGVALADQVDTSRPSFEVRRVSHTGGHRFAPTLLAFPEGRMWAYVDLPLIDRIGDGTVTGEDLRTRARGWWGAKAGAAQVAEIAARADSLDTGIDVGSTAPLVEAIENAQGGSSEFHVTAARGAWRVVVRVGREIPTVACEAPGGLPAKPGREFAWSIEPLDAKLAI